MNKQVIKNFDDDDNNIFGRCGRVYADFYETLINIQRDMNERGMIDDVVVISTPKYNNSLHNCGQRCYFVTNYGSDRRTKAWGNKSGSFYL